MMLSFLRRLKWGVVKRYKLFKKPYKKIFSDSKSRCFFIGIGGIGMSGMAFIMKKMGFDVYGSDMKRTEMTDKLNNFGIKVSIGHDKSNLVNGTDVVVVSSAIPKENPEITQALKMGIPIVKRSFVLGQIMKNKKGIAVSGTHGKTTTTTMVSLILKKAGLDPIAMIGAEVKNISGNYLAGNGEYFIAESCEYDRSFLDIYPNIAIITNIEEDHLDYYRDLKEIKDAFKKFVKQVDKDGALVVCADDANALEVASVAKCKVYGYGFGSKNKMQNGGLFQYWEVEEIAQMSGKTTFSIGNGKNLGEFELHIPGKHNVANACAAIILANHLGIDLNIAREVLSDFRGSNRRFQIKGEKKGVMVVDDYGHHPTEIKSALEGARRFYKGKKIVVVFEPHQYSRTYLLKKEFGNAFGNADLVIVPDIYSVRDSEEDKKKINSEDLVREIKSNGVEAIYISSYGEIVKYLEKNIKNDTIIMTIGAGNIYKVGDEYLK